MFELEQIFVAVAPLPTKKPSAAHPCNNTSTISITTLKIIRLGYHTFLPAVFKSSFATTI